MSADATGSEGELAAALEKDESRFGLSRSVRPAVAATFLLVASCGVSDSPPPWGTHQMLAELTSDLRRFEGLTTDFDQVEVLAWRRDARGRKDRVETALIWGRTGPADAPTGWALVQGFRHPDRDNIWHRSLYNRELKSLLTQPRPGENLQGTWHAYHRYDHAPTVREICDFAAVDFFNAEGHAGYRRVSGDVRKAAWFRVASEQPSCGFDSRVDPPGRQ